MNDELASPDDVRSHCEAQCLCCQQSPSVLKVGIITAKQGEGVPLEISTPGTPQQTGNANMLPTSECVW